MSAPRHIMPTHAMIAAAGLGTRMAPLTNDRPKALVQLAGKTLLDHQLERLRAANVQTAVINVHHFADQMRAHIAKHSPPPQIEISDETDALLETGGGLVHAAHLLGTRPFFVMNVDGVWIGHDTALADLAAKMDQLPDAGAVLLLARRDRSLGLCTDGDFHMDPDGRLCRRAAGEVADWYFSGVQVFAPALLDGCTPARFSTNVLWDKVLARGQLYGMELDGFWMHVGDPAAVSAAQMRLKENG